MSTVAPWETVPAEGRSSPASSLISVLLPLPEGPSTAVRLPGSRTRSTPRTACTSSVRPR